MVQPDGIGRYPRKSMRSKQPNVPLILFSWLRTNKSLGFPPFRDGSQSGFFRQSQYGALEKAVSSDSVSGGIQMAANCNEIVIAGGSTRFSTLVAARGRHRKDKLPFHFPIHAASHRDNY
jgi:hypothetical protein